jgi:hypothetical protein
MSELFKNEQLQEIIKDQRRVGATLPTGNQCLEVDSVR